MEGTYNTTTDPGNPLHWFALRLANTSNDWVDLGSEFNMSYTVSIDGQAESEGYFLKAPTEGLATFYTSGFVVTDYDCLVSFTAVVTDSYGVTVSEANETINGPCEEMPTAFLSDASVYDAATNTSYALDPVNGSIHSSSGPSQADTHLVIGIGNSTEDWDEGSDTYTLAYSVSIDSELMVNATITSQATEGMSFMTEGMAISPYACVIELDASLYDDQGEWVDSMVLQISAPCETVPEPALVGFDAWNDMTFDGVYVYDSNLLEGSISQSDLPGEADWGFYLEMRNVTNDWFETSPTYNLTYEIQIDGEVVAEGYDESAPFDMDRGRGAILLHGGVPREPVRLLGGDARHDQGQREQRHRDRHGKPDRPVRDGARAGIGRLRRLKNDMTFDGVYVYESNLLEGSISQSDLPGRPTGGSTWRCAT